MLLIPLSREAELTLLAGVLALEGLLFLSAARGRGADYDEGVYLAAVDAMRRGQDLGTDIFTAQPPGFYHLLQAGSYLFGNSESGIRLTIVLLALMGSAAAYVVGRRVAGPWGGLLCAALLGTAPSYATYAGRISADLPALAFVLAALAVACMALARVGSTDSYWLLVGGLLGAAFTIKLSAVSAGPLIAVLLLAGRTQIVRRAGLTLGGALLPVGLVLLVHRSGMGSIWDGMVDYHLAARSSGGGSDVSGNVERLLRFPDVRSGFGWFVLAAIPASVTVLRRERHQVLLALLAWLATVALFLAWQQPSRDNHMVLFAGALALPVGIVIARWIATRRPHAQRIAVTVAALLLAGGYAQEHRRIVKNQEPLSPDLEWAVAQVRTHSRPGDLVVSDRQIVPYLADRRIPGQLVDTAVLRFRTGSLDDNDIERTIERYDVPVVVVSRAFLDRPRLLQWLERTFPSVERRRTVTVYWR